MQVNHIQELKSAEPVICQHKPGDVWADGCCTSRLLKDRHSESPLEDLKDRGVLDVNSVDSLFNNADADKLVDYQP